MKKSMLLMMLLVTAISGGLVHSRPLFEGDDESYATFNASLSPYGEWIDCSYGHAWRPLHVANHWRPYLDGRWMWTDYGWYWASNEPFGWATYHYGRWEYDDYYGWIWVPDRVWGPAWVEWRYDDDYIGWAPLTTHASFGLNVGVTFSNGWVTPIHYWNFVPCRNFTTTRVIDYVQPIEQTRRFFGNTRQTIEIRSEHNRIVNRGIDVGFVERRGNIRVNRIEVVENSRSGGERIVREGNRERVEIYRPRLGGDSRGIRQENVQPKIEERRESVPRVRGYRESEQRFELPRRAEQQRRDGQFRERRDRQSLQSEQERRPNLDRQSDQRSPRDTRVQQSRSGPGRQQPQVREHNQPRPQDRSPVKPQDGKRERKP